MLVVNPDTGLSKWVFLEYRPGGVGRNIMPSTSAAKPSRFLPPGVAVPLQSDPFAAIYHADDPAQTSHVTGFAVQNAWVSGVSGAQQAAINTAIKLTKKTYFVQLGPSVFPSYSGSMAIMIAHANHSALSAVPGLGWPPSGMAKAELIALLKILGLYTGHSFMVCDVFGNGDSACFVPDPFDNNILKQTGPAKDANGHEITNIWDHVAGDGGEGLGVTQNPPNVRYFLPPGHGGSAVCGYVDGQISTCIMPR